MYHSVNPSPDAYSISPAAFRRQIRLIRENYPIVPLQDIGRHLAADSARQVVVTFDDAFDDFHAYAYPVLSEYGVPATVFVPTGFVGDSNAWDSQDSSIRPKRVMDAGQLRALASDDLVDFGSHTIDHVSMRSLARAEMRRQACESRRSLQDMLGRRITMFSYPYGQRRDVSAASQEAIAEAGYEIAVTTFWGTRNSARDVLRLRRIWLREADQDQAILSKVDGWHDWVGVKEYFAHALRAAVGLTTRRASPKDSGVDETRAAGRTSLDERDDSSGV